jgi:diadenosine tetraphosphate (Ap4A) HIT family hydrolase
MLPADRVVDQGDLTVTSLDGYPVSPGHTLVIPKRHVESVFDVTPAEWSAIKLALDKAKAKLDAEHQPDGYNVGVNVGEHAGQTVMHVHVHLIPRYKGDMDNPRGGVRHIIPNKGYYP